MREPLDPATGPQAHHAQLPIRIRELEVLRREQVTPKMVRIVFGGPGVEGFLSATPDEHVKLIFPDPDGVTRHPEQAEDGVTLSWPRPFPPTREYTIRRYDAVAGEVWMDFVVHAGGLASEWAQRAEPGQRLWVAGPRPSWVVPPEFAFQVLLADHTALPAVARWLEELPDGVDADVAVVVPDAAEEQDLAVRPGVTVTWYHADQPDPNLFAQHLAAFDFPTDRHVFLWAGAEAGMLKPVRRWAKEHGFGKGTCDVAGYWKTGRTNAVPTKEPVGARIKHRLDHLMGREHTH